MDKNSIFMHTNGTTSLETFSIVVPSFFFNLITTSLISLSLSGISQGKQFLFEFVLLVIPSMITFTVLSDYNWEILLSCVIIISSILLTIKYSMQNIEKPREISGKLNNFLTNTRSTINLLSVISILAVDFHIFPRRFAKTENFGYSLMDLGVGLFIYSNGIVHTNQSLIGALKSTLTLLILGITRFISVIILNYEVPITEYGTHWNFFFTLAVTKIFVLLLLLIIDVKFIFINAFLLIASYELLLQMGLKNFVIAETARDNFFNANKEGIVSSIGYVSLYLLSVYFGFLLNLKKQNVKIGTKFIILSLITLILSLILQYFFGISRKLANSAYVFWILFIGIFMTGLFYFGEKLQKYLFVDKLENYIYIPLIYNAINYNGLAFFLFSNLLTGIINITCNTLKINSLTSFLILIIYMFVNCLFVTILKMKKIKLKL